MRFACGCDEVVVYRQAKITGGDLVVDAAVTPKSIVGLIHDSTGHWW